VASALAAVSCPDLPVKQARQRWAAYVDREADLDLLDGDALLHTDLDFPGLAQAYGPAATPEPEPDLRGDAPDP
jgi:hypothetical protein